VLVLDAQSKDAGPAFGSAAYWTNIQYREMIHKLVDTTFVRPERRFLLGSKAEASAPEIG
jgi:hypothetical protein